MTVWLWGVVPIWNPLPKSYRKCSQSRRASSEPSQGSLFSAAKRLLITTKIPQGVSHDFIDNPLLSLFQAGKMGLGPTHPGAAALPFFCHNGDPLSQPPPAHMGIPPYQLDGKTGTMGEYGGRGGAAPLSPADWRRLGPLLAATGTQTTTHYGRDIFGGGGDGEGGWWWCRGGGQ